MTESEDFQVQVQSATRLSKIAWKDLKGIQNLSLRVHVRAGRMYHLFSLNQVIDILRVRNAAPKITTEGAILRATGTASGDEVYITGDLLADAGKKELQLKLTFTKTEKTTTKHQFLYELRYDAPNDHRHTALLLPARRRFDVLRPSDPSGQEIYDQDGHVFFPRTVRLSDTYGVLASTTDRRGILFSGSNVRFVSAFKSYGRLPDTRFVCIYGRDVVLEEGEKHTETLAMRLIDGLGGLSLDREEAVAGVGALLEKRYVTDDDKVRVFFTSPEKPMQARARVMRNGNAVLAESGSGDLALDVSSLADGDYTVLKALDVAGKKFESPETLTVLRKTYADIEKRLDAVRSFVQGFKVDAAKDPDLARLRLEHIEFKLEEAAAYLPLHEVRQVDGLLKDAERTVKALKDDEPAVLPEKGKLLYSNDFSQDTDDFLVYGNVDMTFSKEKGMLLEPVGTVNMWTKRTFDGSFLVEFDYYPYQSEKGGTMLQLCGMHPNPISQYDFMCSASYGSMAYYMFGVRCYHYSFSRWGGLTVRPDRICNFRKTGQGFYVLSRIPDPIPEVEKWYHLSFVKDRNHFTFFVDGKLVQEYLDDGHQGPFLDGGHIGIRNWSTYRSHFKDFNVYAVE